MFGNHFYHSTIKRAVSVFGTLFNNITIERPDGKVIPVPLAYGPRSRWIARLQSTLDPTAKAVAITLPRMGFEISGIEYDASRKLTKVQKFKSVQSGSTNVMNYNYMPVPYNISYNLYCFTATAEGGLQIIEQISGGFTQQSIAGGAQTTALTVSDGSTGAVMSHRMIEFTGTITGNQIVTIPLDAQTFYFLRNSSTGSHTVEFKYVTGSGSSFTFAADDKGDQVVFAAANDGTNPDILSLGFG